MALSADWWRPWRAVLSITERDALRQLMTEHQ